MESLFGTLNEKSVHKVLKNYIEPNVSNQEIYVGQYIADILNGQGIIEIQTAHFDKLRNKLKYYLENTDYTITIVYPINSLKYVNWVEPCDGSVVERKKSPLRSSIFDIFKEIYKIQDLLIQYDISRVQFRIISLQLDEYKYLDGYGENRKRYATKIDKVPIKIVNDIAIREQKDWLKHIPYSGLDNFTSSDFYRDAHCKIEIARVSLLVLYNLGVIKRVGKKSREYLYQIVEYA